MYAFQLQRVFNFGQNETSRDNNVFLDPDDALKSLEKAVTEFKENNINYKLSKDVIEERDAIRKSVSIYCQCKWCVRFEIIKVNIIIF